MASREIRDLSPKMQILHNRFIDRCRRDPWLLKQGVTILVYCTYRSPEEQAKLYAQGRSSPGRIVTKAKAGQSLHNRETPQGKPAAEAFDFVPLLHGKPVWSAADVEGTPEDEAEIWQRCGEHVRAAGLEWAGDWTGFKEFPHAQNPEAK